MSTDHETCPPLHHLDRPGPRGAVAGIAWVAALAMWIAAAPAGATGAGTVQLLATHTSVQYGWAQVELWQDTYSGWPLQQYPHDSRDDQTGQPLTLFGSGEPPGSEFLLYYAPGWNTGTHAVPILLVMGANDSVDREYADPNLGGSGTCGALSCPSTGLMQYLSGKGYKVFAVNFANPQGDNYQWAQSIADALGVVPAHRCEQGGPPGLEQRRLRGPDVRRERGPFVGKALSAGCA